jgi:hypothetical protein
MRFAEATQQAFSFLEHAGFRLTQSSPVRLHYEAAQAFVTIDWDVRLGELNVWVGFQPKDGEAREKFSLTDLLAMEGVDAAEARMPFQVYDASKLRPFLDRLAVDTQVHARLALAGDRMFFRRLDAYRTAQSDRYWRNREVGRIRTEAEKAWQKRELGKLIALYSSIKEDLTASERAKLTYAKLREKRDP